MNYLFVYGSLKSKKVQKELFGRELKSYEAKLNNYGLYEAEDGFYFIKKEQNSIIEGKLLEMTELDLKISDAFEFCPQMYCRELINITVENEVREVYVYIRCDDVGKYKKVERYDTYSKLTEDEFIATEVKEFKEKEHPEFYKY
ncbi:MAG: gamma-glutamylcyclotransferase [Clostridia bacterium]|nr:gamma-glutamylcyclotransferase [Clostridia bacterium]